MAESHAIQDSPMKRSMDSSQSPPPVSAANGCFDCNICLDYAVEPVVTLCGHLYCWPCIYKWLELESTSPQQCPVCKATLSETTLVPLYGRGHSADKQSYHNLDIPRRPSVQHRGQTLAASLVEPEFSTRVLHRRRRNNHHTTHHELLNTSTPALQGVPQLLGSSAVAVLPWVFGEHVSPGLQYSNPYYLVSDESSPGQQRQEMEAKRSLHRISFFLFCCMVLCLLLF